MPSTKWSQTITDMNGLLNNLTVTNSTGKTIKPDLGFDKWVESGQQVRRGRGIVYFIGNGASASMASHFSADLAKNAEIHTEVFSDLALITALGNDLGFDQIFSEPLARRAQKNDMLVMISSSGESPNIIQAAKVANNIGMTSISITGKQPNNTLRGKGTLNFYVPAETYGACESAHAVILHHWMDRMEKCVAK